MFRSGTEPAYHLPEEEVSTDNKDLVAAAAEYPGDETDGCDAVSMTSTEAAPVWPNADSDATGNETPRTEKASNFVANSALLSALLEGRLSDGTLTYRPKQLCDGAHGPLCNPERCKRLHLVTTLPPNTTVFVSRTRILDDEMTVDAAIEAFKKGSPRCLCGLFNAIAGKAHVATGCEKGLHLLDQGTGDFRTASNRIRTVAFLVPTSWIVESPAKRSLLAPTSYANLCNLKICSHGLKCRYVHLAAPALTIQFDLAQRQEIDAAELEARLAETLENWEPENMAGPNEIPDATATWSEIAKQLSNFGRTCDFATNPRIGAREGGAFVYTWDPSEGPLGIPGDDAGAGLPAFFAAEIPVVLPQLLGMDRMIPLSLCPFPSEACGATLSNAIGALFPHGGKHPDVEILSIRAPNPGLNDDLANLVPAWSTVFAVVSVTLAYPQLPSWNLPSSNFMRKCFALLYLVPERPETA